MIENKTFPLVRASADSNSTQTNNSPEQSVSSDDKLRCPKCGSTHIHIDKEGFKADKACCGAIICGPLGLLFGANGANQLRKTCLECNKSW